MRKLDFGLFFSEVLRLTGVLPLVAKLARHSRPIYSLGYYHPEAPESKAAAAFLIDLHTLKTEEVLQRWYKPDAAVGVADLAPYMRVPESALKKPLPHASFRRTVPVESSWIEFGQRETEATSEKEKPEPVEEA